ncbi:MAG: hypothetical protein HFH63_08125 [Lachnospiraceae bacterium]|nr:hypothetical protein [Lachnospiraceae bacterium]
MKEGDGYKINLMGSWVILPVVKRVIKLERVLFSLLKNLYFVSIRFKE